jgi:hypothetical protein
MISSNNQVTVSEQDLAAMGVQDVAFVKQVRINGTIAYAIHAADGTQMALAPDHDVAIAAIRQHGLQPVSLQ